LNLQFRAIGMMANWIGGSFVHRDKKGDKNARVPVEVVPVKDQREALRFVLDSTFEDRAFGLTPKLLTHMTVDKWLDGDDFVAAFSDEPAWPIHDRIMGLQASTLTMLMNPTTLRRVYDNEFRVPSDQDALTLAELLDAVGSNIWRELKNDPDKQYAARQPMISSLRRNLQQEHLNRLVTLSMPGAGTTEAYKPIANLALQEIRKIRSSIERILKKSGQLDPYTLAHLARMQDQITKALEAQQIYNLRELTMPTSQIIILGKEEAAVPRPE
jgi:hypothetical protein